MRTAYCCRPRGRVPWARTFRFQCSTTRVELKFPEQTRTCLVHLLQRVSHAMELASTNKLIKFSLEAHQIIARAAVIPYYEPLTVNILRLWPHKKSEDCSNAKHALQWWAMDNKTNIFERNEIIPFYGYLLLRKSSHKWWKSKIRQLELSHPTWYDKG